MKKINLALILAMLLIFTACEDYVTELDPYIDRIEDSKLNDVTTLETQLNGLHGVVADVASYSGCITDGLSDQLWFEMGKTEGASYQSFHEVETGEMLLDHTQSTDIYNAWQEARKLSEVLIDRINNKMDFSSGQYDELKQRSLFFANFFAAYAHFQLGAHFAKNPTTPGATVNDSPFKPQAEMFADATTWANKALEVAANNEQQKRMVNTFLARLNLVAKDYAKAATHAALGLQEGDAPYISKYKVNVADNYYRVQAGELRDQWGIAQKIVNYVVNDPEEEKRISLMQKTYSGSTYFIQTKYVKDGDNVSPMRLFSWQENNLILAELALRGTTAGNVNELVNAVRASHGMTSTANITTIDELMVEREKELFCEGHRLTDQLRTGTFHLQSDHLWRYLPIPELEKILNPNFDHND
ncbi:MAG: RagB/SusD family nutrient uptake outer membrane protein [Rhodothermaceae bacterium]